MVLALVVLIEVRGTRLSYIPSPIYSFTLVWVLTQLPMVAFTFQFFCLSLCADLVLIIGKMTPLRSFFSNPLIDAVSGVPVHIWSPFFPSWTLESLFYCLLTVSVMKPHWMWLEVDREEWNRDRRWLTLSLTTWMWHKSVSLTPRRWQFHLTKVEATM